MKVYPLARLTVVCCLASTTLFAQETSPPLQLSGYLETYFLYDFNRPADQNRPAFLYSHNRHQEFNLNLGFIKAAYTQSRLRANLALMAGTYTNANLAAEPGVLKNLFEANIGVKLSEKRNLWLDAGILPSHIGFESAIGKDCWALTRSLVAENSPYYESGARLGYTSNNEKWYLALLALNGWQRIQRPAGNSTPAFGHQLTYKPNHQITLNSSSFIGSDKPDSLRQMRYYHDLYATIQLNETWALTLGFDIGTEQREKGSQTYNTWYTPVVMLRISPAERWRLNLRGEYFHDPNGVIISAGARKRFQTLGYSCNLDYLFLDNFWWRLEARGFQSDDAIFVRDQQSVKSNFFVSTALVISF